MGAPNWPCAMFVWVCLTYKSYFFSQRTVFFSHTKSANHTFSYNLLVEQAQTNMALVLWHVARKQHQRCCLVRYFCDGIHSQGNLIPLNLFGLLGCNQVQCNGVRGPCKSKGNRYHCSVGGRRSRQDPVSNQTKLLINYFLPIPAGETFHLHCCSGKGLE